MPTRAQDVSAALGFSEPLAERIRYHANDSSGDVMNVIPRDVPIRDARALPAPALDLEGFTLVRHRSAVTDFRDERQLRELHAEEVRALLLQVTGADAVEIKGNGILRFSERSQDSGALDNSRPARFVHIDVSDTTAQAFNARSTVPAGRTVARAAQYNVWRVLTPPPQDVPLAVCDARSVAPEDLIPADALFDRDGQILFSFEALVIRHNPAQQWYYFADMHPDEALIFKTHDSDPARAHQVPHGAFDNPACPADVPPRASLEMRGTAFWYE